MAKKVKPSKKSTGVLTIRIDEELDDVLNKISEKKRMTKASLIRNYLELARYFIIDEESIKSLNQNDLILLKKNFFIDCLREFNEIQQIDIGTNLARFINDLARIEGKIEDINYKLDLCHHFGFFNKYIDKENYILFSKSFGPKKFVEAFVWQLFTKGDKGDFDKSFIDAEIERSKSIRSNYEKKIQPVYRDSSYFAFEFAKIQT
ncbi:MAG: hypothetical protein ACTSQJ_14520 [Promethearchaeota archaeon]